MHMGSTDYAQLPLSTDVDVHNASYTLRWTMALHKTGKDHVAVPSFVHICL